MEKHWEKWKNNQLISSNKDIFYEKTKDFFAIYENVSKLDYVYFDIEDLSKTQTGIVSTYKMLSKQVLLKDNVDKIVASPLNAAFYQELLYILGLKEVEKNNKTLIKINFDVENTFAVQVYKYLRDDKGLLDEKEIIDKTFSSIIVWANRLLFIKLFEGQLFAINGEKQEYRILDKDKIKDENDLQSLFFKILGTKDREVGDFFDKFKEVPYLNSSLFELYDVEKNYLRIKDIDNNDVIVKPHSKTKKQGKLKLVEYVIDFLNSYNFSSVSVGESETTSGKEIIDAAVLGLIFEKINGYKDGSYYTPSSITEYICKETIESAVIQKVNEFYNQQLGSFDDLILFASDISKKKQINDIINSLKICDPAVGSGHFLVSALNRIIAIKSELGVLFYHNENKLLSDYEIRVVNDILTITDGNGELFVYNRASAGSFKVQKTIFCEKRQIIENCLFGVDINDKAVSICQLRLWIELLKNAYYENNVMETLPNIDINIKCGNSLVHKLPVEVGKKLSGKADKELRKLISEYKLRVNNYKQESNKLNKQQIKNAISTMKGILHQSAVQTSMDFMGDTTDYAEINLMKNAFEWAIEFPEVLSDDGTFLGFDCVIGNPPYGVKILPAELKNYKKHYKCTLTVTGKQKGSTDTFALFIEKGMNLLSLKNTVLSYIVPMSFTSSDSMIALHSILEEQCETIKISSYSNRPKQIFDAACVRTSIIILQKTNSPLKNLYTTKLIRRSESNTISDIITSLKYINSIELKQLGRYPKIGEKQEVDILKNMFSTEKTLQEYVSEKEKTKVYYRAAGGRYFNVVTPYPTGSTQEIGCPIVEKYYKIIGAILSTSLFWFYQQSYTDGLHIKQSELLSYPVPNLDKLTDTEIQIINKEYDSYLEDIEKNTIVHQTTGYNVDSFKEYKLGKSKHYIDKLDDVVGKLYGLTKEQVDYIKNYEINVRTRD